MAAQTQLSIEQLNSSQILMLSIEAIKRIGWEIKRIEDGTVECSTHRTLWSWGEKITITINDQVANVESKFNRMQLSGYLRNKRNVSLFANTVESIKSEYTAEQLTEAYNKMIEERDAYVADLQERMLNNNLTASERISMGVGGHTITYTLIGLNILIFILMAVSGAGFMDFSIDALVKWGGNVRSLVAAGEYYRLVTNIFLHGGLIHVLFNMYALFFIGLYLEPILGRWRFLLLYLATGIIASVTSIWWSGERVSIGASGAIFGMYGVFLALLTTNMLEKQSRKAMLQSILIFVIYNLMYGTKEGVDNAAHIGGLVSGFVFGYFVYFFFLRENKIDKPALSGTISLIASVVISGLVITTLQDDTALFQKNFKHFADLEEQALAPLRTITDSTPNNEISQKLKTISLPAWQQSKSFFDSAANYRVNDYLKKRISFFKEYVSLRIDQTNLIIKRSDENTTQYDTELDSVTAHINNLIDTISKN